MVGYQDDIAGFIDNTFEGQPEIDWSAGLGLPDGTLVSPAIAPFTRRDINSEDTWGARGTLTWQATDRLSFELMHATQDVTVNSEEFTDPGRRRVRRRAAAWTRSRRAATASVWTSTRWS